jgi:peptidoglycan/xylan/chitin deacetylase (PgdA/CDA1 family)
LYPALRIETGNNQVSKGSILLTFNVVDSTNMPAWCNEISNLLKLNNIQATVFLTGMVVEKYPECVTNLGNNTDIGSMSYSYDEITSISDYPSQLNHIIKGKKIIDEYAGINSTLFRAPYGTVDENIYSLLARAHILADFSYDDHYNVYTNGLSGMTFYRYPINTLTSLSDVQKSNWDVKIPLMVNFDNNDPITSIQNFINSTSKTPHKFVTASELTSIVLNQK